MKKTLLTLLFCLAANLMYAQVTFGPRIALTQDRLQIDDTNTDVVNDLGLTSGYQVGVFMRVGFPDTRFSVQPEVLFTQSEFGFELDDLRYQLDLDAIEVPLMAAYQMGPLRLQLGPTFGFVTEARRTQPNGTELFVRDIYETFSFGYQAGVGIDVKQFVIDLRFGEDINRIGSSLDRGVQGDQRQTQIILALGFKIL